MEESEPLKIGDKSTVQHLVKDEGENFFGGGTQNGRFVHTGKAINIANESAWVDGGVASPNPFYWSSDGYGVMRNTFSDGKYDFGVSDEGAVAATHQESEFDAYYFVTDDDSTAEVAQDILRGYYDVTGDPVLLPEYGFYLGHLNAYNRDGWSHEAAAGGKAWTLRDAATGEETTTYEFGRGEGYKVPETLSAETLNGEGPKVGAENFKAKDTPYEFSARAVIDRYDENDMPLGWFLPNDGYGAGYGQNGYGKTGGVNEDGSSSAERLAAVDANVENLGKFSEYANSKGVETGLWTQSDLTVNSDPNTEWQTLRDFEKEVVTGGVGALKTDVAWVGPGYSFALDGVKQAYDIVTTKANKRPNIVSLDGWAGTQRFAGIWTGDQYGGDWEYIRFHIPTYIGTSLSGNPNIGSDMDAIYDGEDPVLTTRDYQWKSFTPMMLDMDGWGGKVKSPHTDGDPYNGINRMYLKLKSQLLPYIYTTAASAANIDTGNDDTGMPIVRAMFFEEDSDLAESTALQYQYMLGGSILVAPVYEDVHRDESGNDVRNNIYLPGTENDIWIDYWSGEQYRGGQTLNNFEAPVWKTPVFVKANAILPMYEANNNPKPKSEANDKGLDKTNRMVEFFATEGSASYTGFEDDGASITNVQDKGDEAYGAQNDVSYGGRVSTVYTSEVDGDRALFTIGASEGGYAGYDADRLSTFVMNVSSKPEAIIAKNGSTPLTLVEAGSKGEFDAQEPEAGTAVYFYDEEPNLNAWTPEGEGFADTKVTTTPKLYVKLARTDVSAASQSVELTGFSNTGDLPSDSENAALTAPTVTAIEDQITPTSISIQWDEVEGATAYDLKVDGRAGLGSNETSYKHTGLAYDSTHTYQVRARNDEGVSAWSEEISVTTAADPWRNTPSPVSAKLSGKAWGGYEEKFAFDHKTSAKEGCMLSDYNTDGTLNASGWHLDIDYGLGYKFESLDYYTSSFGYAQVLKVESSLDGVHWTDQGTYNLDEMADPDCKSIVFDEPVVARYIRLTCEKTKRYFTAAEICLNKIDGSKGFAVGSLSGSETCTGMDYGNLGQVLGYENRGGEEDMFAARVSNFHLDLNENGAYDVYDLAHFMAGYAPNKKDAKVSGELVVKPRQKSVKAGDVVTVDVKASEIENANALGALIHFNDGQFEFVTDSLKVSDAVAGMNDYTRVKTQYTDGVQAINLALTNEGDKVLYSGDDVIATFQLRAKEDAVVELDASTWAIGALLDFSEGGAAAVIDRAELQAIYDAIKAENLVADKYTTDTWEALALALSDAERLLDPAYDTTQETVDQCAMALKAAREALRETSATPVDPTREALGGLIAEAEKLDTTGKTESSIELLQVALKAARDVYANDAASAEQIADAYNDLRAAMDGLVDAEPIEEARKELEGLVAKAEKVDTKDKTQASVATLNDALAHAKEILGKEDATASELEAAFKRLKSALDGLKTQADVPPTGSVEGDLPQTGDASAFAVAGTAAAGIFAAVAGVFASRKKRRCSE